MYLSPYQNQINWRFGTTQVNNRQIYTRPEPAGTAYSMTSMLKNETTDSLYVNGELVGSEGDKQTAIAGCRDVGNLGRGYNDSTYFAGDFLEVLVYTRALSDAELQGIHQYLRANSTTHRPRSPSPVCRQPRLPPRPASRSPL